MVLEARSLKSKYWQGHASSETPRGGFFFASFSFGSLRQSLAYGGITPISAFIHMAACPLCVRVFTWHSPLSYKSTSHIGLKAYLTLTLILTLNPNPNLNLILTWLHLQRPYFQIRSHSQVPRVRTSTYLLWGHKCSLCQLIPWIFVVRFLSTPCYSHGSPEGHQCQIQWHFSVPILVTALQYLSWLPFLSSLNPSAELTSGYCAHLRLLLSSLLLQVYHLLCLFLLSPSPIQSAF